MKDKFIVIPVIICLFIVAGRPIEKKLTLSLEQVADKEKTQKALMDLMEKETLAFYNKDLKALSNCWGHGSYVRHMGWWKRGGIKVVAGWDSLYNSFDNLIKSNPGKNEQKTVRKNYNFRIAETMAWCTFDEYGQDNQEPDMDMPGLSRATRIFEKQNGEWKIVYVGWLLNG